MVHRMAPATVLVLLLVAGIPVPTRSSPIHTSPVQLAVATPVRSAVQLSLVSADGLSILRLTAGPGAVFLDLVVPRVGDAQIYITKADGTGTRRLTRGAGLFLLPTWAPDGTALAFLAIRNGDLAVTVIRPDGSGERRLLSTTGDLTGLPLFAWQPR